MNKREELEKLSVHELRIKARALGVKAPTTKKQSQLIQEIIQIESGELSAFRSKMGRPPKNQLIEIDSLNEEVSQKTLINPFYAPIINENDLVLENGDHSSTLCDCLGVIRQVQDKWYIRNYSNGYKYVTLTRRDGFRAGDLVIGKAYKYSSSFGRSDDYSKYPFNVVEEKQKVLQIKNCAEIEDMYQFIRDDEEYEKIVVEVEANIYSAYDFSQEQKLYLHTNECADIMDSYNLLLDVKNTVHNLCEANKKFAIYFVDVEYIYSILSTYFHMRGVPADVNAGQYFKEILSNINNSKGGKITLFEKEGCKRSSYLDIILNRYCKKIW